MNDLDIQQALAERMNEEMLERCSILLSDCDFQQRQCAELLRKLEVLDDLYLRGRA